MDDVTRSLKKFDLHVHTFLSKDSLIEPRLLPKVAVLKGLSGFAVTDHDAFGAHLRVEASDAIVVPGMEIRTVIGDVIVLFIQEPVFSRDPLELSDEVKAQDGVLIAAHPFGFPRIGGCLDEEFFKVFDGIEVFNARNLFHAQNRRALELAKRFEKAEVGGSDAHSMYEVGRAYTLVEASSLEELRLMLKKRMTRASGSLSLPLVHLASITARIVHALRR
jgi:predicted metal-dependent phosphoesterase TrpH